MPPKLISNFLSNCKVLHLSNNPFSGRVQFSVIFKASSQKFETPSQTVTTLELMTDYGDIQIDISLVNHQKQPGTLKCSMQYVLWEPDLIGEKLVIPISTVKSHKISAEGKDKVQIRLIINDGTATVGL